RTLGVRADITSQVARIDAHGMQATGPNRLCYADSVLHTTPSSLLASRCPIRIGAELYGHAGNASDVEVIALMLETLRLAQVGEVHLAFGHVGIYRALLDHAGLDPARERALFRAIQHKAPGEIEAALTEAGIS